MAIAGEYQKPKMSGSSTATPSIRVFIPEGSL
jgi:hypothetical protein